MRCRAVLRHRHVVAASIAISVLGMALAPLLESTVAAPAVAATAPTSAQPESSPAEQAASTGQPVEVSDLRSETSQVFANPDGTFTQEISAVPVRVRRQGAWVGIDTTLQRRVDGTVAPRASALDLAFSGGGTKPLASLRQGGLVLDVGTPFVLPAPTLSGSTATYADVLPGVDLVMTAQADSYSQLLVVKTAEAAGNPALSALSFGLHGSGLTVRAGAGKTAEAVDSFGNVIFDAANPLMWDSSGSDATSTPAPASGAGISARAATAAEGTEGDAGAVRAVGGGPLEGDTVQAVPVSVTGSSMVLAPDAGFLKDPARAFPVFIDPTYSVTRNGWAMVNQNQPNATFWKWGNEDNGQGVGYNDTEGPVAHKRLFYEFDTGGLSTATILSADFRAYESWSYSCTRSEIQAWWTETIWSGTNWNNQPQWRGMLDSQTVANGWRDCNPGGAWLDFNAINAVKHTTHDQQRFTAIGLRADDEGSNVGWKRFLNNATLSVTYNHPPQVPTGLGMTNPSFPCRAGSSRPAIPVQHLPRLTATPWDDDTSENVHVDFEVWRMFPDHLAQVASTGDASQGDAVSYALQWLDSDPDNTTYRWRARTVDPLGPSNWSQMCEFTLDKHAPATPTISLAAGNGYHLGSTISVTFGNGGSSDVRQYWWSLNNDATTHGPVSSSSPTVSIPLSHFGPSVLYVRSVDAAGQSNLHLGSASFVVDWNGIERDRWALDERSGTTAADEPSDATTPITANVLTLSGTAGFLPEGQGGGAFYDWGSTGDGALRVLGADGPGSATTASSGLVDDGDNWTLMGWLQPAASTVERVAISQNGLNNSTVAIGVVPETVTLEGGGTQTQLRFVATLTDALGAVVERVENPKIVNPGEWYHVSAIRQAVPGSITLMVIDQSRVPAILSADVDYTPTSTRGPLRLGSGTTYGATRPWQGLVDDVRNFQGSMTVDQAGTYAFQGE